MTERKGEKLFNFLYNRDFETSNYGSPSQIDAEEGWGRLNYLNEMSDEEFDKILNQCNICNRVENLYCCEDCYDEAKDE